MTLSLSNFRTFLTSPKEILSVVAVTLHCHLPATPGNQSSLLSESIDLPFLDISYQ